MTQNPETPEENSKEKPEETIAERSARLEQEAAALAEKHSLYEVNDPLAPEPHPEDRIDTDETTAQESDDDALSDEQGKAIINALQNELESAKDQVARAMAETENTRRRARKEREDASKYAISNFAKDLLDVSDNLRRALEALPTDLLEAEPRLKNVMDGVEATERTLLKNFEKHHITKIEPLDEPFNPNFHEVMFESPVPGKPAGIIMQVLEPGYILHDRLLRPARVGVTKDDGTAPQPNETSTGDHIDTSA